jgi:hypothetical protein
MVGWSIRQPTYIAQQDNPLLDNPNSLSSRPGTQPLVVAGTNLFDQEQANQHEYSQQNIWQQQLKNTEEDAEDCCRHQ